MPSKRDVATKGTRTRAERFLQNYGLVFVYIGIVVLVTLSVSPQPTIDLSWETVALVALLLVTPFVGNLKRIWVSNVGGVELDTQINETRASVDNLVSDISEHSIAENLPLKIPEKESIDSHSDDTESGDSQPDTTEPEPIREFDQVEGYIDDLGGKPSEIATELYRLLESDPRLALAKLRIEMEEAVDRLIITMGYEKPQTTTSRYNILQEHDGISNEVIETYSQIRDLCNKAIHGEDLRMQDAIEIVDIGVNFISGIRIREVYERFKKGEEISEDDMEVLGEHPITEDSSQ